MYLCVTGTFYGNQQMLKPPKDALENVNHIFAGLKVFG